MEEGVAGNRAEETLAMAVTVNFSRTVAFRTTGKTIRTDDRTLLKLAADPTDPDPTELTEAAFRRHCVDLHDLSLRGRFDWSDVPGWARLWIWDEDLEQARVDLGLGT
jgi:hypothetical protein